MSVLANEIFLTVASILVGSVDARVCSDFSFTEDPKERVLIIICAGDKLIAPRSVKVLIGYTKRNFMKTSIPTLVYIIIYTRPC